MSLSARGGLKWLAALCAACALLFGCGHKKGGAPGFGVDGDGGPKGRPDTGVGGSSGNAAPSLDAGHDAPPAQGTGGTPSGTGGTGGIAPTPDDDGGVTYCDRKACRAMADDCHIAYCDPRTGDCVVAEKPDGAACGSQVWDTCTLPDTCSSGVCLPNDVAKGMPCGDQSRDCHYDDACDGHGQCADKGLWAEGTACGDTTTNTACDAPDSCDATGVCAKNYAALDAPCGDQGKLCNYDDGCDGAGQCVDKGTWALGNCPMGSSSGSCVCGRTSLGACHPAADICVAGACSFGNADQGTPCGNGAVTSCSGADVCDGNGACSPNDKPGGTACTDYGTICRNDGCDGFGNCMDLGIVNPCTIHGRVTGGGNGLSGVLVETLLNGPNATSTDGSGNFQIDVEVLGKETLLHVGDASGYWGDIEIRNFSPSDTQNPLPIALQSNATVTAPASGVGLSLDANDGALVVKVSGTNLTGNEGATLSAPSSNSIAPSGGGYAYSTTTQSSSGGPLYFYNLAPGTTAITPVSASSNTCARPPSDFSQMPIFTHSLTQVPVVCQ